MPRITGTLTQLATGLPIVNVADVAGAATTGSVSSAISTAAADATGKANAAQSAAEDYADGAVAAIPDAAAGVKGLAEVGTTAGTVAAGDDSRLGTVQVHLPSGSTVAASGIAGITSVTGGIANALPPYVYGRDAASLLAQMRQDTGKSLFVFGDSLSTSLVDSAIYWDSTPISGTTLVWGSALGAVFTQAWDPTAPWSPSNPSYARYPNNVYTCVSAVTAAETYINTNAIAYGMGVPTGPAFDWRLLGVEGREMLLRTPLLFEPTGVAALNIRVQAWTSNVLGANYYSRSALFSTYAATDTHTLHELIIPATFNWGSTGVLQVNIIHGTLLTVPGQTVTQAGQMWLEPRDGTGLTVHNMSAGGATTIDYYDDTILPPAATSQWILERSTREPWLMIDLGQNGAHSYNNEQSHVRDLLKIIGQFRAAVRDSNAKIILRTHHPSSTSTLTSYYMLAAYRVARENANVILVDTMQACEAGGGYATAVANGWMGDTVHRTTAGMAARERMYSLIVAGVYPIPYSSTIG